MKKKWIFILIPLMLLTVLFGCNSKGYITRTTFGEQKSSNPNSRMLDFGKVIYGTSQGDFLEGINWRIDYSGNVTAFCVYHESGTVDIVEFVLSPDDTEKLWNLANSLEGSHVLSNYTGYIYGLGLYKYDKKGNRSVTSFDGLPEDFPASQEIFDILMPEYEKALESQN